VHLLVNEQYIDSIMYGAMIKVLMHYFRVFQMNVVFRWMGPHYFSHRQSDLSRNWSYWWYQVNR